MFFRNLIASGATTAKTRQTLQPLAAMSPVSGNLLVLIVACMSGANWLFMDLMRDQCLKIYMVRLPPRCRLPARVPPLPDVGVLGRRP